jgi:hypothetical protein
LWDKLNRRKKEKAVRKPFEDLRPHEFDSAHTATQNWVPTGGLGLGLRRQCSQGDRSHGADIDAGSTVPAGAVHPVSGSAEADHRVKTPFDEIHLRPALLCFADTKAASAQHAPVRVIVNEGMVLHNRGVFEILFKALWFQAHPEEFGDVLKSAFLVGVTVSAIHIVNGEE